MKSIYFIFTAFFVVWGGFALASEAKIVFPDSVSDYLGAHPKYLQGHKGAGSGPGDAYMAGRVAKDWSEILPHLPKEAKSALDIGSGIGGVDLLIFRRYAAPRLTLAELAEQAHDGRKFDVLKISRDFLTANGVPGDKLAFVNAQNKAELEALSGGSFDLIISLRALAYWFPYEAYEKQIKASLAPGGTLILDLRKMAVTRKKYPAVYQELKAQIPEYGVVIERLKKDFRIVKIIHDSPDSDKVRVLAAGKK